MTRRPGKVCVYVCPDKSCRTVLEACTDEMRSASERPRCICGVEMKRAYAAPSLKIVEPNGAGMCAGR